MTAPSDLARRRDQGKNLLQGYLRELRSLFNCQISENSLINLDLTDQIREKSLTGELNEHPLNKYTFKFSDKNRLALFINLLSSAKPGRIIAFTDLSHFCGAVAVPSLRSLNWLFDFNAERSGIVSIVTEDLEDSLLLDFYEDEGEQLLDLEARGKTWSYISLTA